MQTSGACMWEAPPERLISAFPGATVHYSQDVLVQSMSRDRYSIVLAPCCPIKLRMYQVPLLALGLQGSRMSIEWIGSSGPRSKSR